MQINFEAKQIKAAHAYVDRLTPVKVTKKIETTTYSNNKVVIDNSFYTTEKEEKTTFIKSILNFLFK
jgi:hypothetical protein